MDSQAVVKSLRRFLLLMAGFLFAGTIVELIFQEHTGEPAQLIPFVLCGLGIVLVGLAWLLPRRGSLLALRGGMLLCIAGGAFGLYEHIEANLGFAKEILPAAGFTELLGKVLTGAAPLLAPGMLAIAALLALAATYAHPALARSS